MHDGQGGGGDPDYLRTGRSRFAEQPFQDRLNHGHEDPAATVFPGAELLRLAFGRR